MLLFSQGHHITKSFISMYKMSSYGNNSQSLSLYLWAGVYVGFILATSQAEGDLLQPSLPLTHWCPPGVRLPRREGALGGHCGTEAQQFKHDLLLVFWLVEKTCLQVKSCFFNQLQCVGANHQSMVSILVLFHCVWSLNLNSEMFIIN